MPVSELSSQYLRAECKPDTLSCTTSEELSPLEGIVGQDRALRALRFGLGIADKGFNIYVAGQAGTGRTTAVRNFLQELAKTKPTPSDWVYFNNFKNQYEPRYLKLPPGKARELQADIRSLIDATKQAVPKVLQSEEFRTKREEVIRLGESKKKKIFNMLNEEARREKFVLQMTPMGLALVPLMAGTPLSDEEYMSLPSTQKREYERNKERLTERIDKEMREIAELDRATRERLRELTGETLQYAIGFLMQELMRKYSDMQDVIAHLNELRTDVLEHIELFSGHEAPPPQAMPSAPWDKDLPLRRYEVNIIVDNAGQVGAPVVFEENPTYINLFGRIEKEAQFGTLTTDFTLIKPGSLHKANGGFLVLPVEEVLRNLFTYEGLKRALRNQKIVIEEAGERLGFITTKSLTPQPIPLDAKVVLIGNPLLYHLLYSYDPDFRELFKVKAQFDTTIDRTQENLLKYASFICTLCVKEGLRHLHSSAIAKVVDCGSRLAEDQRKLSTSFAEVADIIREANYYASQNGSKYIEAPHIQKAIEEKIYRSNLIQQKIEEMINRDLILIDTSGEKVGQVNGLSVIGLGDYSFGRPSRVTASIALGREGVTDIERESKMGGPIHTKGVLILSGYLASKYSQDKPLSLSARLVFEQSYEGIEGDSASSTELYAILSALSDLKIKQNLAMTGSVNQKGEVQAIGGVNAKIEGFFEVCKVKGLRGDEGVLIPESNVQNLMLKEEVVEAVKQGKFHIYPVKTIDQGIELLTGVKAGERTADGEFESDSVNFSVNKRLREMAEALAKFGEPMGIGKRKESEED